MLWLLEEPDEGVGDWLNAEAEGGVRFPPSASRTAPLLGVKDDACGFSLFDMKLCEPGVRFPIAQRRAITESDDKEVARPVYSRRKQIHCWVITVFDALRISYIFPKWKFFSCIPLSGVWAEDEMRPGKQ